MAAENERMKGKRVGVAVYGDWWCYKRRLMKMMVRDDLREKVKRKRRKGQ